MSLSIRKNSKGRALHATAPHPPAKRLASYTNPILAIPTASSRRETCAWCLRNDRPVTACTGCRACSYCSKTCQRAAWKESHKLECPALGHVPSGRELPTPVRALLRVVVKAEAWGAVLGLAGNEGAFREERGRWEDLRLQGGMVRRLLGKDPAWVGGGDVVEKYAVVMCKLLTNMFNVHDPDFGVDAVFLHPALAMANHSCVPTASAHIHGRTAILVSERDIAEDDEITISYTDTAYPLAQRRQDLAQYHFECTCPRCTDDLTPYGAALLHPLPKLNAFSLASDPFPRGPPKDTTLQAEIHDLLSALPSEPTRANVRQKYKVCEPLVTSGQWASLAPFLNDCLSFYLPSNSAEALLITALSATRAHPVSHAPFSPHRLKGALAFVRALRSATADPPAYKARLQAITARAGAGAADLDLLREVDPIAMARMVLFMVSHYLPVTQEEDWPLAVQVREAVEEVKAVPWGADGAREGMERWERDERDEVWVGVWRRMVSLVDGFAELGARLVVADFGEKPLS